MCDIPLLWRLLLVLGCLSNLSSSFNSLICLSFVFVSCFVLEALLDGDFSRLCYPPIIFYLSVCCWYYGQLPLLIWKGRRNLRFAKVHMFSESSNIIKYKVLFIFNDILWNKFSCGIQRFEDAIFWWSNEEVLILNYSIKVMLLNYLQLDSFVAYLHTCI